MYVDLHGEKVVLAPWRQLGRLWGHRGLIRQMMARETSSKYRGSYLGILWSVGVPLMMMCIYAVVFGYVFKSSWQGPRGAGGEGGSTVGTEAGFAAYALTLFAGLMPFNFLSEVINRSPGLILGVPSYVKRVVFPLETLTLTVAGAALFNLAVSLGVFLAADLVLAWHVPWTVIYIPLIMLPLVLVTVAISWVLASLGTYVRDIAQFVGVAMQMVMFMSPIFWPASRAPESLKWLVMINPLTPVVEGFRGALVFEQAPDWGALMIWTVIGAAMCWGAHIFFMYTKRGFADVI